MKGTSIYTSYPFYISENKNGKSIDELRKKFENLLRGGARNDDESVNIPIRKKNQKNLKNLKENKVTGNKSNPRKAKKQERRKNQGLKFMNQSIDYLNQFMTENFEKMVGL